MDKQEADSTRLAGLVLDAVAYASIIFLRSSDPEAEMPEVLRQLGFATRASRAYVFQNTKVDGELADSEIFEWNSPGIPPVLGGDPSAAAKYLPDFERYVRVLGTGGTIAELTKDAPDAERSSLERDGVLSYAIVPIFVADGWWGYIGFDDCESEHEWSKYELSALRTVAETFGAALERKTLDTSLRALEERYRTLVEHLPVVVYTEAPEGPNITLYCSPQIQTLLGYTPDEWMNDADLWETVCHPDDIDRVNREDEESKATGHFSSEYRLTARDGHVVWVQDEEDLITDSEGNALYWLGVLVDISARKTAEAALGQSSSTD